MKIAVITSTYPRYRGDGAGSFIHSLSSALVQIGHHVIALAPYDPAVISDWQSSVEVKRVHYIWPKSWSRLGHARSLAGDVRLKWHAYLLVILFTVVATFRLWAEVVRRKSDVIYAHWLVPGGFIGAVVSRLTGVPLVVSLHGSDVFVAERYVAFRPIVRFIFRTVRQVIACSTDLARRVGRMGLPQEIVHVIPYGVDVERYSDWTAPGELGAALSIPESHAVIMVMGRLVHKKGFAYFLRAIPSVAAKFPNTRFIVAGDGDLRVELEGLAESLNIQEHVTFTGHIPWQQTPAYLSKADIFAVPSVLDDAGNVDGLPNVLLEAMASGCAVVASDVAGIPEVIRQGENGLLVPQRDEQALADAICALLSDPQLQRRMGNAARATASSSLSWARIAERIAGVLQSCIQGD